MANADALPPEAELANRLTVRGETLALAESCTGGLVSHRITNVPGSSRFFLAGFVTYGNRAKTTVLGVDQGTLDAHGAVSRETVEAMALGARRVAGADWAAAVSGIAGPGGGTPEKPVGLVYRRRDRPSGHADCIPSFRGRAGGDQGDRAPRRSSPCCCGCSRRPRGTDEGIHRHRHPGRDPGPAGCIVCGVAWPGAGRFLGQAGSHARDAAIPGGDRRPAGRGVAARL